MRERLLESQLAVARQTYDVDPRQLQGEDRVEYVRYNVLAAIKELTEMLDEVDGWKPWQTERANAGDFKDHTNYVNEGVDVILFLANLFNVACVDDEVLDYLIKKKQQKNTQRQKLGYAGVGAEFDLQHPQEVA